ncbi:hypothetical protein HYT01_03680 [Candidatus Giovannonibacteria bacterium]|nr:hypothetical protein [Candidatus Giovannonibacteria bacterium]
MYSKHFRNNFRFLAASILFLAMVIPLLSMAQGAPPPPPPPPGGSSSGGSSSGGSLGNGFSCTSNSQCATGFCNGISCDDPPSAPPGGSSSGGPQPPTAPPPPSSSGGSSSGGGQQGGNAGGGQPGGNAGGGQSGGYTIDNWTQSKTFGAVIEKFAALLKTIGIPLITIFLVWAGFMFVTARGNEQQITKAKSLLFWTIIGAILIVGAVVLAEVVVNFAQSL